MRLAAPRRVRPAGAASPIRRGGRCRAMSCTSNASAVMPSVANTWSICGPIRRRVGVRSPGRDESGAPLLRRVRAAGGAGAQGGVVERGVEVTRHHGRSRPGAPAGQQREVGVPVRHGAGHRRHRVERHESQRAEVASGDLDVGERGGVVTDLHLDVAEAVGHDGGDLLDVVIAVVIGGDVHPVSHRLHERDEAFREVGARLDDRHRVGLLRLDQGGQLTRVGLALERVEREHPERCTAQGVGIRKYPREHHPGTDQ